MPFRCIGMRTRINSKMFSIPFRTIMIIKNYYDNDDIMTVINDIMVIQTIMIITIMIIL
jgi:hypothetical protein